MNSIVYSCSLLFLIQIGNLFAYSPPVGIPNPRAFFGGLDPIDNPKPDTNTYCPGWHQGVPRENTRLAGDEHDGYFIDNTHPQATDTANSYGRPDRPRKTIPNKIFQAGDYIEIHGDGNPEAAASPYTGLFSPRGAGTSEKPIWFVGVDEPVFTGATSMGSVNLPLISYIMFDGLQWRRGGYVELRPRYENNVIDHIVFRHCKIIGAAVESDPSGFALTANSVTTQTQKVENIVLYNSEIAHMGSKSNPNEECCIAVRFHVRNFWCLDSDLHHAAEDGIIMSHAGKRTSSHIYVGRNKIHENITNAIDIKGVGSPVVISENHIWGHKDLWTDWSNQDLNIGKDYMWKDVTGDPDFSNVGAGKPPYTLGRIFNATGTTPISWGTSRLARQISSGSGESCVFHYSTNTTGPGSYLNYPEDVTFMFNTVEGGRMGISTILCGKLRILGNVFRNTRVLPTEFSGSSNALEIRDVRGDMWVCHNTFHDCEGVLRIWDAPALYNDAATYFAGYVCSFNNAIYVCINENGGAGIIGHSPSDPIFWKEVRVRIFGNILANTYNRKNEIHFNVARMFSDAVDSGHNCIFNPSGLFFYNYRLKPSDITADPLLLDPSAGDFSLNKASPCIDVAIEGVPSPYADFEALTGIDIRRDIRGQLRPQGKGWDIGAHEALGLPRPNPPKNLKVEPSNIQ